MPRPTMTATSAALETNLCSCMALIIAASLAVQRSERDSVARRRHAKRACGPLRFFVKVIIGERIGVVREMERPPPANDQELDLQYHGFIAISGHLTGPTTPTLVYPHPIPVPRH